MRRLTIIALLILVLSLLLVACGGGDSDTGQSESGQAGPGDSARGEVLYKQNSIGAASAPGCKTCHSLDRGVTLVGPSHFDIGARAGSIIPGQSAEAYLRESIVNPSSHIVEGFSDSMYQNYGRDLTEQEIADLVAFLVNRK